jgi:hypothetical protein
MLQKVTERKNIKFFAQQLPSERPYAFQEFYWSI